MKSKIALVLAFAGICALGAAPIHAEDAEIVNQSGVGKLDKTFAIEANHGLMRDTALAVLAMHRANNQDVRKFAAKIHDQRNRAHQRLRKIAQETRLRLPERLDAYQRDQVRKLSSLKGEAFDRQFLQYIAETDHVRFYIFELNSGALPTYPPVRKFAREQLPILRNDMARARKLLQNQS